MPIHYNVLPNALTSPPSYTGRPVPQVIHDYDSMAEVISLRNPTIPEATAKTVLQAFREEVVIQLSDGNSINLSNFISFVVSMPIRLENSTDPLPADPVDVKGKPSPTLKEEVENMATYTREPYFTKAPDIEACMDTNSEISNWVRDGFGVRVDGSDIGFDPLDDELGITLLSPAGNEIKQENLSLNEPSTLIFTCVQDVALGPAGRHSVENQLSIKSRYTVNGKVRLGIYSKLIRITNKILFPGAGAYIFVTGQDTTGPATLSAYTGTHDGTFIIVSELKPTGRLVLSASNIGGSFGPQVEVTEAAAYVLSGVFDDETPVTLTVTVADMEKLIISTKKYSRYFQEICTIDLP